MSTLTFVSNQFLSIYHIHSLDHIFTYTSFGIYSCCSGRSSGGRYKGLSEVCPSHSAPKSTACPLLEKKKEDRKRAQQTKVASSGLEGFVDGAGIISSEPAEEEKNSRLAAEFALRVRKQDACSKGEFTPISDGKRPKRSSPNGKAQKDWVIILMDSLDQASNDQPVLEGEPN